MSDQFHLAALSVRAEQFLKEKRASARGVDAVTYVNLVRSIRGMEKTAEPPPPKGVSVKEWDKILSKVPKK